MRSDGDKTIMKDRAASCSMSLAFGGESLAFLIGSIYSKPEALTAASATSSGVSASAAIDTCAVR
jgi:hypothetical protein